MVGTRLILRTCHTAGLNAYKGFIFPVMFPLVSGWCYRNNVFLFPFFTGINHKCLDGLTAHAYPRSEYIYLGALGTSSASRRVIILVYKARAVSINESWLRTCPTFAPDWAPIDILTQELGVQHSSALPY